MNLAATTSTPDLTIAQVEQDTGLSKDVLRAWERRYGFPQPTRQAAGDRHYPAEQVQRLRALRRLIESGHRPGQVVPLDAAAVQALVAALPEAQPSAAPAPELQFFLDLIRQHDVHHLRQELSQAALRLGLAPFIQGLLAPLTTAVGDAWAQGRLLVFEEHLYAECVTGLLRQAIGSIPPPRGTGAPRVLLTTLPGEPHGLGLLMVEALLALEGCHCLALGPQTPIPDIVRAANAHAADLVALSFTPLLGARAVRAGLAELRQHLPLHVALWVGGECPTLYQPKLPPGVAPVRHLSAVREQVAHWRIQAIDIGAHLG